MDIRCSCEKGFSIRGYAASKRGSSPDVSSIYPPNRELSLIEVPSFRYWQCFSCVETGEDATVSAPEGNIVGVQDFGALEQRTPVEDAPTNAIVDAFQLFLTLSPPATPKMAAHTLVQTTVTEAPEGNIVDVQCLGAPEDMHHANTIADAIQLPVMLSPPKMAPYALVTGATEAPGEEQNAGAIDLIHQSEEIKDKPEVDQSGKADESSKSKRKYRSLADIIGDISKESQSKAVSESPTRKRASANQPEWVPPSKRDKGKAIVTSDAEDAPLVRSMGEGLFIGSKEERQRSRTEVAPTPSRKKAKHALTETIAENVANLKLPVSLDQNDATLSSSEGLTLDTAAHSKHPKLCLELDLSLGTNHHQYSGAKGNQVTRFRSDISTEIDLNEAAIPVQENMDFLQLGPKDKSLGNENQNETNSGEDIFELLDKQQFDAGHSPMAHGSSDWMRGYSGHVGTHVASVPSSKASPLSLSQSISSVPTLESLRSALTNSLPSQSLYSSSLFLPPPSSIGLRLDGQPEKDRQQHRGNTISDIKAAELRKTKE